MAERNQLKIADRHGIADDDPFAELTRIMGFDPREPARPQAVEPELSASPEGGAHDDFDIDLEKELMGDFSLEGEEAEPGSAFAELPSSEQSAISAEEDEARSFADADQPAFDDGMDDAVAASLDEDVAVEQAAVEQAIVESPRWDDEPAYEETAYDEPAYEPAHAVSDEARRSAPEAGVAETNDAETDVAAALEGTWFEPVLDDEDQFAAEDGAEALAGSGEGDADEPAFDTNAFDAAIAAEPDDRLTTVHMSDDAQEDLAYNPDAVAAHDFFEEAGSYEPASYELASYQASEDHEADALAAPATGTGDLEDHFDAAMADVDMDFEAREADVSGFAAPDAPVFAAGEEAASDDIAFDEDFASADFDEPVQAAAATQAHPAPVETPDSAPAGDTSLEDELNALLARMTTRPAITEQPAWPLATPVACMPCWRPISTPWTSMRRRRLPPISTPRPSMPRCMGLTSRRSRNRFRFRMKNQAGSLRWRPRAPRRSLPPLRRSRAVQHRLRMRPKSRPSMFPSAPWRWPTTSISPTFPSRSRQATTPCSTISRTSSPACSGR
jgi:hypothetical protein